MKNLNFRRYLKVNKIHISESSVKACEQAVLIMKDSHDPIHNDRHVFRMLNWLIRFRKVSREVRWEKVNYDILILSICWHDIWKSKRLGKSVHKLFFHQLYEGLGSMRTFGKISKLFDLDPYVVKKVKYAIRKHSMLQIFPTRQLEAKILKDLDRIDEYSCDRVNDFFDTVDFNLLSNRSIRLYKFYFDHWMIHREQKCYFLWSKSQIDFSRPIFYQNALEIFKKAIRMNPSLQPHLSLSTEKRTTYPRNEG